MRGREPVVPHRRRRIPPQFSWVDHRLVREGYVQGRSATALALYLFLVTVADAEGMSWYSEAALCGLLSWSAAELQSARAELQQAGLIAYRKPLAPEFAQKVIAGMEGQIRTITRSILAEAAVKRDVEMVHEVVGSLPTQIIGQLFGMPEADWEMLHALAERANSDYSVFRNNREAGGMNARARFTYPIVWASASDMSVPA